MAGSQEKKLSTRTASTPPEETGHAVSRQEALDIGKSIIEQAESERGRLSNAAWGVAAMADNTTEEDALKAALAEARQLLKDVIDDDDSPVWETPQLKEWMERRDALLGRMHGAL